MAVCWWPRLFIKAVSTGGPSVRLLEPSRLGCVCAFSWTSIAKMKVSQHACVFDSMWTFEWVRFRARLSCFPDPTSTSLSKSLFQPHRPWRSRLAKRRTFSLFTHNQRLPELQKNGTHFKTTKSYLAFSIITVKEEIFVGNLISYLS